MCMITQHSLQRLLQQMGRRVCTHNSFTTLFADSTDNSILYCQLAFFHHTVMQILATLVFLHIVYAEQTLFCTNSSMVSNLTTHFSIHHSLIQHNTSLFTCTDERDNLIVSNQSQDLCLTFLLTVANKCSGSCIQAQIYTCPGQITQCLTCFTGTVFLLFHKAVKGSLVHGHIGFFQHFHRQIVGETIGVIQLKGIGTGEHRFILCLILIHQFSKDLHAAIDGLSKAFFFSTNRLGDMLLICDQFRIMSAILLHNGIHNQMQEGLSHTQQTSMSSRTAQQTAQHVTASFIGRTNTVGNQHYRATNVVSNYAQRNITLLAFTIVRTNNLANLISNANHGINIKQAINILYNNSQTLQTHTGIDILLYQFGIVTLSIIIELGENVVPDLHKTVTVAAYSTIRLAATVFLATVVVNLGTRAARTGTVLPEVVGLAQASDSLCRHANFLGPNLKSFLILFINRGIKTLRIHSQDFSQKLPAHCQRLRLKVIAKGKVTQHLEISTVSGSLTNIFNIAGTHTLLAGANTLAGRLLLTGKEGLHGSHTGIDQQQRCIVLRNQRKSGQTQMIFALKICQKAFTQFIQSKFFHIEHLSIFVSVILLISGFSQDCHRRSTDREFRISSHSRQVRQFNRSMRLIFHMIQYQRNGRFSRYQQFHLFSD